VIDGRVRAREEQRFLTVFPPNQIRRGSIYPAYLHDLTAAFDHADVVRPDPEMITDDCPHGIASFDRT
jgi:hypothetical protein